MKTVVKTPTQKGVKVKVDVKQIEKDKLRAIALSEVIAELQAEHEQAVKEYNDTIKPINDDHAQKIKPHKTLFDGKVAPILTSIETAKKELLEIGSRQRKKLFDTNGNFEFPNGLYIHAKTETKVKLLEGFDLSKFAKKFSKYFDVKWKIAPLKKLFMDGDLRKKSKIDNYFIDLTIEEELELKKKATEAEEIEKG